LNIRHLLFIILVAAMPALASCGRSNCTTAYDVDFTFQSNDSIPDSSCIIVCYTQGQNFATVIDTPLSGPLNSYVSTIRNVTLPVNTSAVYTSDWKIFLLPSGKSYAITKLQHGNSSQKVGIGGVTDQCVNSTTCDINGTPYVASTETSSSGSSAGAGFQVSY